MTNREFSIIRKKLNKTQKQLCQLLGGSAKAVSSYEQGWRPVPTHVERHLYFLLSQKELSNNRKSCWSINNCPTSRKKSCSAWEFNAGKFCWLVNGTNCKCHETKDCGSKLEKCKNCKVMNSIIDS